MNLSRTELSAYLAILGIYLVALFVPYYIDPDVGIQVKSLTQFLHGESPNPNTAVMADPQDLSKVKSSPILWFSPAFPFIHLPLVSTGLPLQFALRTTNLLFFLLGVAGLFRVCRMFNFDRTVEVWLAVSLPCTYLMMGGVLMLIADCFPFGLIPWLFIFAWTLSSQQEVLSAGNPSGMLLLGLALGLIYPIKYSAIFISAGIAGFVVWDLWMLNHRTTIRSKVVLTLFLSSGFLGMIVLSMGLQKLLTGDIPIGHLSKGIGVAEWHWESQRLFWPLGAWGASMFNDFDLATHLVNFMDKWFPFMGRFGNYYERTWLVSLACLPGTFLVIWALLESSRACSVKLASACWILMLVVFGGLSYISFRYYQDVLVTNWRYTAPFISLIEMVVCQVLTVKYRSLAAKSGRTIVLILVAGFIIAPLGFDYVRQFKQGIIDRVRLPSHPSQSGLYLPYLSRNDLDGFIQQVEKLRRSPKDVVTVIVNPGHFQQYGSWLVFHDPILPLLWGNISLYAGFGEAINTLDPSPIKTSQDLRIILLVARDALSPQMLAQLKARFPQAANWTEAPPRDPLDAEIWYSDLKANPPTP